MRRQKRKKQLGRGLDWQTLAMQFALQLLVKLAVDWLTPLLR